MPSRDEYCPVAKAADAVGDRWSVLLIREMLRGVHRFNQFERSIPGIPRSVLAQRLRRLEQVGILVRRVSPDNRSTEYRLTDAGLEVGSVVKALNDWGVRWLIPDGRPSDLDPDGLMRWIGRHVVLDRLPPTRVVVAFQVRTPRRRFYWLVLQSGQAELCPEDPGFGEDLRVTADPAALYGLFLGREDLSVAIEEGLIRVDGPRSLVRALPSWFRLRVGPESDGRDVPEMSVAARP